MKQRPGPGLRFDHSQIAEIHRLVPHVRPAVETAGEDADGEKEESRVAEEV